MVSRTEDSNLYLAEKLLRNQQGQLAVAELEKVQDRNSSAAIRLGNIYELGADGVPQDFLKASMYYQRAIGLADLRGYACLGRMHLLGRGMPKDDLAAYRCFLTVERKGKATGPMLVTLGRMHQFGWGIPIDFDESEHYYKQAANLGNVYGLQFLGLLLLKRRRFLEGALHIVHARIKTFFIALKNERDPRLQLI